MVSVVVDEVEAPPSPVATSLLVLEVVVRDVVLDVLEPPPVIGAAPPEAGGTTTVVLSG